MDEMQPTLEDAWAVATRLPPAERRMLARHLLQEGPTPAEDAVVVVLRRLASSSQARLENLLIRSNEGTLAADERAELVTLVAEYERVMTSNTEALLRASQPELFDDAGRLVSARLSRALRREAHSSAS